MRRIPKRRRFAPLALMLVIIINPHAQSDDSPSPPAGWVFEQDVAYGSASERQRLDIVYPANGGEPRPLVILMHSGGWYLGDKGGESTLKMMCYFAEDGYVSASIGYRLVDEGIFPAAINDCKHAVRWLRAHAETYGIDSERIGAMGASAGGHLAAMLAATRPEDDFEGGGMPLDESSAVQAAVAVCAPFDLQVPLSSKLAADDDPLVVQFIGGPIAENAGAARRASPISFVHAGMAPVFILHGTADGRVEPSQARVMNAALEQAGVTHELVLVEGGRHGMGIGRDPKNFAHVLAFLDRHLKGVCAPDNAGTVRWWRDAKFGLFVHWGPASLTGKEISWSRAGERPGLPELPPGDVPVDEYDALYTRFDPVEFDADEWAAIAKEAGMQYLVFTTKHHDGFCMFHSALTDYTIAESPFKRDIAGELATAFRTAGFGMGFYYSLPDWHHPAYLTGDHAAYNEYMHGQVRELCTNYGDVDLLWFDGKGKGPDRWDSPELVKMIRALQPRLLVNNRVWGDTDFDTPEQVIGRFQPDRPWESCITLGQQWAWKPGDDIKTWQECVRLLALAVGGGGNMMLNVGPMPSGAIEPRQVEVLRAIGVWLEANGEAIYATRPGPYPPSYWGASTQRGDSVFLLVLDGWTENLELPSMERRILSAALMNGEAVKIEQTGERVRVQVPEGQVQPPVTIVTLTLDGPASSLAYKPTGVGIPVGAKGRASNVRRNEVHYAGDKAVDDDPLSRWASDDGVTEAWLEIDLPEAITFDVIMMDEAFGSRIQQFELQVRDGDSWKTFHEGTTVGRNWAAKFPPVTAQFLRLIITNATDGPTIRDIRFHMVHGSE